MMTMRYSFMSVAFCAALLFVTTQILVVYSAGYVSDACKELCSIDGNSGDPLSSAVETQRTTEYNFVNGQLKTLISAYGTGTEDDIAAKAMYGQDINCWNISELTSLESASYDITRTSPDIRGITDFNSRLDCWDTSRITSMRGMFSQAKAFNQDISMWDVSGVKNFEAMFYNAKDFNQDISDWDTSNAFNMTNMFALAKTFNQDIGDWDTSNVKFFNEMFLDATIFNQDINGWDTSSGENFNNMFNNARFFNQDISDWDTSNVIDTSFMFANANVFNQDISDWDTSNVEDFRFMFSYAQAFNQDISSWDTSNVKDFGFMFLIAKKFNQDISSWVTTAGTNFRRMFLGATSFNQNLCGWKPFPTALEVNTEFNPTDLIFVNSGCDFKDDSYIGYAACQVCRPILNTNEVLAIGDGGDGKPHGTVGSTIVPLTIVTFFEAHPSQFEGEGIDEAITIEVYANVDEDENDCTKGTLLEDVGNDFVITTESKQYDDYNMKYGEITGGNYPVTSNGVIGSASVTITDFQYVPTDENKKIWFLGRGDKDGEIELCVVTSIKIDYDKDDNDGEKEYYVTHMDSKRIISIDLVANIGDQVVDITESKATDSKTDLVVEIDVDTFVCNNKNEKVKDDRSYTIGQNFRICVGPTTEGVAAGYKVENFIELTCGDRSVINAFVVDPLTNIDTEYKNDKLAVQSVLTADDTFDGKASVTCNGKVSLSYTATPGSGNNKRLLAPSSIEVVNSGGGGGGAAGKESLEGLFNMNIKMNNISPIIESSSSSVPPLTTTAATIIIGFGSVLSFVVAFFY